MLKEKYEMYKQDYKKYLVLIKSGNFYLALNNDAIVMNKIFKYKIMKSTNFIKNGFPINALDKILEKLIDLNVNYIVVNEEIIKKEKFKNNDYNKYFCRTDNYEVIINRIHKINELLEENLDNPEIRLILDEMENTLCKINY